MGIAQHASNLNGFREEALNCGLAIDGIARKQLGHHRTRDIEQFEQVVVPLHRMDVEEHSARGIGVVGSMYPTLRQFPDEPSIDGSHEEITTLSSLTSAINMVEQPLDARGGEIWIDEKTTL